MHLQQRLQQLFTAGALLLLLATGCTINHGCGKPVGGRRDQTTGNHVTSPRFITLMWAQAFAGDAPTWKHQIQQRWPDRTFVVMFCHGNNVGGKWCLQPDAPMQVVTVESVAQTLHTVYPGRLIVLVSCNPYHEKLKTPNVAYCPRTIWIQPQPDAGFHDGHPAVYTGNIWEFVMTNGEDY